jgi:hypothetical protein
MRLFAFAFGVIANLCAAWAAQTEQASGDARCKNVQVPSPRPHAGHLARSLIAGNFFTLAFACPAAILGSVVVNWRDTISTA